MYFKIIFAIWVLVQCAVGQTVQTCENIQTVSNLNLQSFSDTWFVIEVAITIVLPRIPTRNTISPSCGQLDAELTQNGALSITSSLTLGDELVSFVGTATVSSSNSGTLNVVSQLTGGVPLEVNVLAIDYDDYALLLLCMPGAGIISAKLSRSRDRLSPGAVTGINAAVAANTHLAGIPWFGVDQSEGTCGSSASVTVASTLLLAVLAVINIARRT